MLKRFSIVLIFLFIAHTAFAYSPDDVYVNYHFLKGYYELYRGEFSKGADELYLVYRYVKKPSFYDELSDILIYSGKLKKAENLLKYAIKLFPKKSEFYYKLFDLYTIENKKESARLLMNKIKKLFKNNAEILKKEALEDLRHARYKGAYKKLKKYVSKIKTDADAYYWLAKICLEENKTDEAVIYGFDALRLKKTPQTIILMAQIYERRGKYLEAVKFYKLLKENYLIDVAIANDLYMGGKPKEAIDYYMRAFKKTNRIDFLEHVAYIYLSLKDYKKIYQLKRDYPEYFNSSEKLLAILGMAYALDNNCNKAYKVFSKVNKTVKFYGDVVYGESYCFFKEGRYDEIEKLKKYAKDKKTFFMLADYLIKAGRYKKAIAVVDDFINKSKNNKDKAEGYFFIADIYFDKLKDINSCIEYLKKAIKLNPSSAEALNYLGYLYIDKDIDVKGGMQLVIKALKIKPNNPYYLDSLGWGYFKLKDYNNAVKYLKKAVELFKKMPFDREAVLESLRHLKAVYEKLNNKEEVEKLNNLIKRYSSKNK
ncbi:tetratricopeptide repeat protein [Hippea jasoniae]|uniref:tetratricopeptide repeat protein n=1 Tax=Hippea jasoniae TaxID=944479 RepID=UPI0005587B96|nr:tetratricopeptide repeat protein [Hippea jasoniae]